MEISTRRLIVDDPSAVGEARRMAGSLAGKLSFDAVDAGRVSIVATELASNIVKHAGRGVFLATPVECEAGVGVEILALDNGPGVADANRSFEDRK